jgi:hypothetical protein|tara:strand:- start:224 stop:340 length:117 start_codon:yes stop_codon:yes gene_type:complete
MTCKKSNWQARAITNGNDAEEERMLPSPQEKKQEKETS